MSKRPTLAAVAAAAGVSTATVDRVLNSRLPVREATAVRVITAAEAIGYHAAGLMRERLRERAELRTLGFCLQQRADPFYQALAREISAAASRHAPQACVAVVEFMDALEPLAIADQLLKLGREVDAIALVSVDHPHVTAAIDTLHGLGKPAFALLSDLGAPQRAGYVGVDCRKTGRTAAWAVAHLARAPGPVGLFVGSHRYLGHETSEISFRSYLRENAPEFRVLDTQVNLDDPQLAYEATLTMLARQPDLVGLYAAGGGQLGIIRALREEAARRPIVAVCNDLVAEHRAALVDGVVSLVIGTPVAAVAATAVGAMLQAVEAVRGGGPPMQAAQFALPFDLYTPENV